MNLIKSFIKWFTTPSVGRNIQRKNFINVQIDAIGVGLASAASPFLPVFLTRLDATTVEVSLLTSMPAFTGLLLSIPLGQFLQKQTNIVRWFSIARLMVIASYALTGLATFLLSPSFTVKTILLIWALATIPQTIVSIAFSVVMNSVAGPDGRYELMTRRWSILGITTTLTVLLVGQILDNIIFPLNYRLVFLMLSLGGLISYYFSSQLDLPPQMPPPLTHSHNIRERIGEYINLIIAEKPFTRFISRRFVFTIGTTLAAPLFPIYFVRQLNASDSWIATITTAQSAILILGYFFWTGQTRRRGAQFVLLATTFGLSLYPIMTGLTSSLWPIPLYAGLAGIFQAGLNLVFFDELMRTVPDKYSATFVAVAQVVQYVAAMLAPFLGTALAEWFGFPVAFIASGALSLIGFALFLQDRAKNKSQSLTSV